MNSELMSKIQEFVLNHGDAPVETISNPSHDLWRSLRNAGTEIWLDTGDIDQASVFWSPETSALTTNNTLLNNEIQKGIYDDLIVEANSLLTGINEADRIVEIAFILNATHGLRLVHTFGGKVSVELHTDLAHDIERSVAYAKRLYAISPGHFIIKVPLTPSGYIATRRIRELGIPVNFTLNFSARQNLLASVFSKPSYVNVFLGRLNAFVSENQLGDGLMVGEKTTLASQRVVTEYSRNNPEPTLQIAASMRDASQVKSLAGVDVFTLPVKVAEEALKSDMRDLVSCRDRDYAVHLNEGLDHEHIRIEKLWQYSEAEHEFAHNLDKNVPETGEELMARALDFGITDLFPVFTGEEKRTIASDGKLPVYKTWAKRIKEGTAAIDSLMNAAGLGSFTLDQEQMDNRVRRLTGRGE